MANNSEVDSNSISTVDARDKVLSLRQLQNARPVEARCIFRQGHHFKEGTGGLCRGFTQANIAGIHGSFAEDFAAFCSANEGPLPLLHCYPPGVFAAPGLADDSDIRTDLTAYNVLRNGEYTEVVKDLLKFGESLKDFAFAYTGCSFSFDKVLLDAGISLSYVDDPDANCSMYRTNISCHTVGPFGGPVIVSMRLIPRDKVEVVVRATHPLTDVHGAPMHIGNPVSIGIHDLQKVDYGDPPPPLTEDQVPVFWGCGNTIKEVLKYSKLPLSFTMYTGGMYICDTPVRNNNNSNDDNSPDKQPLDADIPVVIELVNKPYTASVLSQAVLHKIQHLGQILKNLESPTVMKDDDDLLRTSLDLSHASSVALTMAAPVHNLSSAEKRRHLDNINRCMMGTIALATFLQVLGKKVTLIVEPNDFSSVEKVKTALVNEGILQDSISLLEYPPANATNSKPNAKNFLTEPDDATPRYNHLVSLDPTSRTDHVRQLFVAARELNITTSWDPAHEDDPCCTPSKMYGYAITIVLYLLRQCTIHDRYRRFGVGLPPSDEDIQKFRAALPSIEREASILEILVGNKMSSLPNKNAVEMEDRWISQLLEVLNQ